MKYTAIFLIVLTFLVTNTSEACKYCEAQAAKAAAGGGTPPQAVPTSANAQGGTRMLAAAPVVAGKFIDGYLDGIGKVAPPPASTRGRLITTTPSSDIYNGTVDSGSAPSDTPSEMPSFDNFEMPSAE